MMEATMSVEPMTNAGQTLLRLANEVMEDPGSWNTRGYNLATETETAVLNIEHEVREQICEIVQKISVTEGCWALRDGILDVILAERDKTK